MPVHALNPPVTDPNVQLDQNAPLLITSIHTAKNAGFIELHNQGSAPVKLSSWTLRYSGIDSEVDIHLPDSWLLPDNFVVLSENGLVAGTIGFPVLAFGPAETVQSAELIDGTGTSVSRLSALPADLTSKWYQRKSTGISGVFVGDFSAATASTKLRHTPLYNAPVSHPVVRVVEVYSHASNCAPNDAAAVCSDYVKLYNPSDSPLDLRDYRLRSDSGSSLSGNAFHLDNYGLVPPGSYMDIRMRDDGSAMSLTDDGGYVWIEDAEGVERYDETIVQYPSASSTTKIGWAWALDGSGQWQWTSMPSPSASNSFPVPGQGGSVETSSLSSCPVGKYRSPDTNRCRTVEETINALATCDEGSERNPETNRCRKTATLASATLAVCEVGQERNPETNRCRKVAGASTGAGLTPCKAGQERSPETNRCRKIETASTAAITDPPGAQGFDAVGGIALGIVGLAAVSYGAFEWRSEIVAAFGRLLAAIGKK